MTSPTPKPPLPRRTPQRIAPEKIQEAVEARDALAAALTRAGIQLPAMDVRTRGPSPTTATPGGPPATPSSISASAPRPSPSRSPP
ncbi:hypothetical protein [Streptomyces niveus]|uniref:hypothetical protein n=1 Tax=Streptomyces niveus TaxID=193462 RepID=UPI00386ABB46